MLIYAPLQSVNYENLLYLQKCPGGPKDFRAEQCKQFNDMDIDGENSWLPYESDNGK